MKRLIITLTIAALALPATALAKGPSAATMDGPGGGGGITFTGNEGSGPLGDLTQHAGFFPAAFAQEPSPMLPARPKGDLGPKYTITYTVPGAGGDDEILQEVYPYAAGGPVTYTAPGQQLYDSETRGGWFHGGTELKKTLVAAGLPANAPAAGSSDDTSFPTTTVGLLGFALLLVGAAAVLLRRRARPAAA
jgi:hypothetical protein